MTDITTRAVNWTETGLVPDTVIRAGIRRLLENKRREICAGDVESAAELSNAFVEKMNRSPIALVPDLANEQHYEVPAAFFARVMGQHLKYSCGYWPVGVDNLSASEAAALQLVAERAEISHGMRILDLGCGWGSFSLFIAEQFPGTSITAVSNSAAQRDYIMQQIEKRGTENVEVITADMNEFDIDASFDRIISIEMFEHMRNYRELFRRVHNWLAEDGRFFLHVFCHRSTPYEYIDKGPGDWMSRYFFSGGIMPSADLPLRFADHLSIRERWHLNGRQYSRTCEAWLESMDAQRAEIMPILEDCYGPGDADKWWQRWRMFFMACSELFAYGGGDEWFVGHYLFARTGN